MWVDQVAKRQMYSALPSANMNHDQSSVDGETTKGKKLNFNSITPDLPVNIRLNILSDASITPAE